MMANVPRFYHIHRRSRAKIVATSGHLEVKKSICVWARPRTPQGEFSALPQTQAGGEGLATPSPKTPPRLGSPFALPWKNPVGAHGCSHSRYSDNAAGWVDITVVSSVQNATDIQRVIMLTDWLSNVHEDRDVQSSWNTLAGFAQHGIGQALRDYKQSLKV